MLPVLLVVVCTIFRVVPHPPNFTPVGATAVFAGRTLRTRDAAMIMFGSMLLSDVALGWLHGYPALSWVTPFVYVGFGVQLLLGRALRGRRGGALGAAALGSLGFFLVSNAGVWVTGTMYPHTASGLVACFVAALPFFGATFCGDVVWTLILTLAYRPLAARMESCEGWVPIPVRELSAA